MKLSDTTTPKLKQVWAKQKAEIIASSIVIALVLVGALTIYILSPSTTNVPKADKAQAEANVLIQQAITSEANANVIRAQRVEKDKQITSAKRRVEQTTKHYDEVRNTAVHIDNTDLDNRERKLQSDLANLYPGNR